ncbi:MAG: CBS domain-containing protein [Ardenticatenaceae bacterium]|nr:CBS domain-containing protein [Ardenticatenaceae bacterium]
MTRHPIMIMPTTPAAEAQKIMSENSIRHLPVTGSGKKLLGLVTRQSFALESNMLGSLDVWEISRYLGNLTAEKVMTKAEKVMTIAPNATIERAARVLAEHKIGCLPVIEDGVVVGILTEIDLLHAFQEMLGLPSAGVRVTMRMVDKPGEFAKLTAVLGQNHIGVMGIGTYPTPRQEGYYDAVLKIRNVTLARAKEVLSQVPEQEIVDIREAA